MTWRRNPEAAKRLAERRQRENEAPRLAATFPKLESLGIRVQEGNPGLSNPAGSHIRHVVVATAPALFVLPCGDSQCQHGGHELTAELLSALRSNKQKFEGENSCTGSIGSAECRRVLRYEATASYRA
jgi:hypothetical protein